MVYISIGSNVGNKLQNLRNAVKEIEKECLRNIKLSIVLETEAILKKDSPNEWNNPFLNMIISGDTDLSPKDLLMKLKDIESKLGRKKDPQRWAPRIIDLDILLYKDYEINTEDLIIPHPELKNRAFFQHLLALMGLNQFKSINNLNSFKKSFVLNPELVGIVNITDDSFSDGGKFYSPENAIKQVLSLVSDGASVIDIGAQSTRPGAVMKSAENEINALRPVLDGIKYLDLEISIDTFREEVVEWLLKNYKISWINDVKCSFNDKTLNLIRENNCKICVMHSLTVPADPKHTIPQHLDPIDVILEWGTKTIYTLRKIGFTNEKIVVDPGIGFGKIAYQNIKILQRVSELKSLGVMLMIGHSRKGYINAFTNHLASERDIETVAVSNIIEGHVDYLRVHDVAHHMRSFVIQKSFKR